MLFFSKPDFAFNFLSKMAISIPDQCNLSLVFMALLCHISRVFISPLISGETNGLGLDLILVCLMGA